jgi:hypothetical protein
MMNRNEANLYLAAILETVAESAHGAPSGHMYAALMGKMSLDDYSALLDIASEVGLVKVAPSHLVTITPKGADMVAKIKAHRATL